MELSDILVGRKQQIESLDRIMESREAEFVVVYGRHRVGKTFLVNAYFNDEYSFNLTGLAQKGKQPACKLQNVLEQIWSRFFRLLIFRTTYDSAEFRIIFACCLKKSVKRCSGRSLPVA